jgi:DNA uptake protein ComE-like DNA-binding protein
MRLHQPNHRAFIMVAVLMIVGASLYVATYVLFQAQADVTSSSRAAQSVQLRSLAWSGVQAVMACINDQRERMLAGESPVIDGQYTIYESAGRMGIVRLLADPSTRQRLVAEAGKLDLNTIDADALERTGMVDSQAAAAIVAFRSQQPGRRFQSVADLLRTPGGVITAETLWGPLDDFKLLDDSALRSQDLAQRVRDRLEEPHARGLADVVTVYSWEPAVQTNGSPRINLHQPWNENLAELIATRFSPEAAQMAKQIADSGVRLDREDKLFQTLRQYKVPTENWPALLDAFTTEPESLHMGRLDLNTAPAEALRGLPGITAEQAAQIVRVRSELSPHERSTIAWPAIAQVLPPESFDALAGHITTRCWTWQVMIAAGEVPADAPDGEMLSRVVYQAVIDSAGRRPRVAYLRDITSLAGVIQLSRAAAALSAREPAWQSETAQSDDQDQFELGSPEQAEQPATAPQPDRGPVGAPPPGSPAVPQHPSRLGRWRGGG